MTSTVRPLTDFDPAPLPVKKAALVLRAINNKLRRKIILLLHEGQRMTVTSIHRKLDLDQSVVSQHLAILRAAGLVITEREGKYIFYSVNYQRLKLVHQVAEKLVNK